MKQYRSRSDSSRQEKDCPLCQQFGRGPCKDEFYAWNDCTEEAAGSGRSEDEITEDCAKSFDDFRACLDQQANNSSLSDDDTSLLNNVDAGDFSELRNAWHQIIHSDLAAIRRDCFPSGQLPVIKKKSDSCLVSFSQTDLVLVFVQSVTENGVVEVVAAAAAGDLIEDAIRIPSDRLGDALIVSAVYETLESDSSSELVVCEERVQCDDL